jgi:small GTP-binding protein
MNVIGVNDAPHSIFPHIYKVMIIGRCGVGKTSLLWRYLYNEFKDLRGTIVDKETKKVNANGRDLELELWDTARLETHCTLSPQYLKDADAVIIVYDITDPSSYVEVKDCWIGMVCGQFGADADQRIPIIIVGCKSDLIEKYNDEQTRVRPRDVKEDIKSRHSMILGPIECSSKTGKNVDKVFNTLAEEIIRRGLEGSMRGRYIRPTVVTVDKESCNC